MAAKRRVVAFLYYWQRVLGIGIFLDPVFNSFVEVSEAARARREKSMVLIYYKLFLSGREITNDKNKIKPKISTYSA